MKASCLQKSFYWYPPWNEHNTWKIGLPKRKWHLPPSIFRGELLVSGSVPICLSYCQQFKSFLIYTLLHTGHLARSLLCPPNFCQPPLTQGTEVKMMRNEEMLMIHQPVWIWVGGKSGCFAASVDVTIVLGFELSGFISCFIKLEYKPSKPFQPFLGMVVIDPWNDLPTIREIKRSKITWKAMLHFKDGVSIKVGNYHQNPQPSFLGVITHILWV